MVLIGGRLQFTAPLMLCNVKTFRHANWISGSVCEGQDGEDAVLSVTGWIRFQQHVC